MKVARPRVEYAASLRSADAARSGIEQFEELAWSEDGRAEVGEGQEVPVAGNEVVRCGGAGKCDQVVVVGIRRDAGQLGRVGEDGGVGGETVDERDRDGRW